MLGGPSLRLGIPRERLSIPSGIGWDGNDTGRLVTWEFPLRTDSASWNSFESIIQFISFCNSCIRPESANIVFWSSTSFRLAKVSNEELWNFLNSSISVRLLWWSSRNSKFCCENCPWRSCWSRCWTSSARAAWNSCWLILAWHSARMCSFCLSSTVLICALSFGAHRVAPVSLQRVAPFYRPLTTTDRQVFS